MLIKKQYKIKTGMALYQYRIDYLLFGFILLYRTVVIE